MTDSVDAARAEAERYLALPEDDLYRLIVPDSGELYSPEGRLARGKTLFVELVGRHRELICARYRARATDIKYGIDLVALVAAGLAGSPAFAGIPLVAFSALVVKIGLDRLCPSEVK